MGVTVVPEVSALTSFKCPDEMAGLQRQCEEEVYVTGVQPVRSSEANLILGIGYRATQTKARHII